MERTTAVQCFKCKAKETIRKPLIGVISYSTFNPDEALRIFRVKDNADGVIMVMTKK